MKKAVIDSDNKVVNVIELEDGYEGKWSPPDGFSVVNDGNPAIGDTWDGTDFLKRVPKINPQVDRLDELRDRLAKQIITHKQLVELIASERNMDKTTGHIPYQAKLKRNEATEPTE